MKKSKIITIIILVVLVVVMVIFFLIGNKKIVLNPTGNIPVNQNKIDETWKRYPLDIIPAGKYPVDQIQGNKDDLDDFSFSVFPKSEVSDKFIIQGVVKGNYFFEGNILVNILDANKKLLRSGHATAMGEWMTTEPVKFQGDIDFTGLSKGPAYIEIHNDNASGLPANDKSILIPIIIQ